MAKKRDLPVVRLSKLIQESEPRDLFATWPVERLRRMDTAFVQRLVTAIRAGKETAASITATVRTR